MLLYVLAKKGVFPMEVYEKLTKPITETKYLSTENSYRYRPIMRCFYEHYEKLEYWLYKEDIYNELKNNTIFAEYTIEECERDLEALVEWKSLTKMQDTKNASTIEEFKNKKFRYQLTEYATEIERLTISLEEMEIKTASLEPKLFDRIRITLNNLEKIETLSEEEINTLWKELNEDFTKLNENYQDFLKKFNEQKSEELLQSTVFLAFKNEIIKYLREFIRGYQKNVHYIRQSITNINDKKIEEFLSKLVSYQKSQPLLSPKFDFSHFREVNAGKIKNIFKWFTGTENTVSEGDKLMSTTDNIIVKITKYANSLIELHGNMTSRKEEYRQICKLFDNIDDVFEAHKYASVIFGIESVRHYNAISNFNTDTIVSTYDIPPIEILLSSRTKSRKEKISLTPIVDKSEEKKKILEEYRKEQAQNKEILKRLLKNGSIKLEGKIQLSKIERRYIQKLLTSSTNKETEFGLTYKKNKKEGKCTIISEDGIFIMQSYEIQFEGDYNGK